MRARRHSGYGDRVEEIDRKILLLLARDGRMSFTDLARQTGLSVSATHQRVRRLERRGLIRGYTAVIDPADVLCCRNRTETDTLRVLAGRGQRDWPTSDRAMTSRWIWFVPSTICSTLASRR